MPDAQNQAALPVPPVETPLPHVSAPTENSPAQTSLAKKIADAGNSALEKFGIIRRGRGRPRNDGQPKKSDVVEVIPAVPSPAPAAVAAAPVLPVAAAPAIAPAVPAVADVVPAGVGSDLRAESDNLFRKILRGGAKGATEGLNNVVKIVGGQAGLEGEFLDKTLELAKPAPDAIEDFSASVDLAVRKHAPSVGENGDLWCLGLSGCRLFGGYALVLLELQKEIARKKRLEKSGGQPSTSK